MDETNMLEASEVTNPFGESEECAKFTIVDLTQEFALVSTTKLTQTYTLSFWIKSDMESTIVAAGERFQTFTAWSKYSVTFQANKRDVVFIFENVGTYYIYHAQLEIGTKATDWTPSPEDVDEDINDAVDKANTAQDTADEGKSRVEIAETLIQQLRDSIQMLVRNGDSETAMVQDENGWYFNIKTAIPDVAEKVSQDLETLRGEYDSTEALVSDLQTAVQDIGTKTTYVNITGVDTLLVEEQEITGSESLDIQTVLVSGETYRVIWDGVEYECVAIDNGGSIDLGYMSGEIDFPFRIEVDEEAVTVTPYVDEDATHTFSIYQIKPCIELGDTNSEFKVVITNTAIRFMEGSNVPAYINNQSLFINRAVIEEELEQGEFAWKARANGNLGLIWKGGTT